MARDAGQTPDRRHIVAVIGDGSMTGGMAYEALNNLGHSKSRVIIVLNDNGRSYAPTISNLSHGGAVLSGDVTGELPRVPERKLMDRATGKLSRKLTDIRLNPVYVRRQRKFEAFVRDLPVVGKQAESGKTVSVHYTGQLENGKTFDSSYPRKKPIEFPLGKGHVIEGWDEGIALLKVGDKARFVIPSYLGYGSSGAGGVIPPDATLIFDVELMDVK